MECVEVGLPKTSHQSQVGYSPVKGFANRNDFMNLIACLQTIDRSSDTSWTDSSAVLQEVQSCKYCQLPKHCKRSAGLYGQFACLCDIDFSLGWDDDTDDGRGLEPDPGLHQECSSLFDEDANKNTCNNLLKLLPPSHAQKLNSRFSHFCSPEVSSLTHASKSRDSSSSASSSPEQQNSNNSSLESEELQQLQPAQSSLHPEHVNDVIEVCLNTDTSKTPKDNQDPFSVDQFLMDDVGKSQDITAGSRRLKTEQNGNNSSQLTEKSSWCGNICPGERPGVRCLCVGRGESQGLKLQSAIVRPVPLPKMRTFLCRPAKGADEMCIEIEFKDIIFEGNNYKTFFSRKEPADALLGPRQVVCSLTDKQPTSSCGQEGRDRDKGVRINDGRCHCSRQDRNICSLQCRNTCIGQNRNEKTYTETFQANGKKSLAIQHKLPRRQFTIVEPRANMKTNYSQNHTVDVFEVSAESSNLPKPRIPRMSVNSCVDYPNKNTSALDERNNSNGTHDVKSGRSSHDFPLNTSLPGRVIRVEGDGRCMFRSLITAAIPLFHTSQRDEFGRPQRILEAGLETDLADQLRATVVKLMEDNMHFYSQLEKGIINADQPQLTSYLQFKDRLEAMSKYSTMPGDLELNAAAMVLERQIVVLNTDLMVITSYGQDRFPQSSPLAIRFTRLGPDFGHYDAVIFGDSSEPGLLHSAINLLIDRMKWVLGMGTGEAKTDEVDDTSASDCHDNAKGCARSRSGVEQKASCHQTSSFQSTTDMRQRVEYDNDQFSDDNNMLCKSNNNKQLLMVRSRHRMVDASTQTGPDVEDEDDGEWSQWRFFIAPNFDQQQAGNVNRNSQTRRAGKRSLSAQSGNCSENNKKRRKVVTAKPRSRKKTSTNLTARKKYRHAAQVFARDLEKSRYTKKNEEYGPPRELAKRNTKVRSRSPNRQIRRSHSRDTDRNPDVDVLPPHALKVLNKFNFGLRRCILCRKKLDLNSSTPAWLNCYLCGRVAHRDCVIKDCPAWGKVDAEDNYFLCNNCVLE